MEIEQDELLKALVLGDFILSHVWAKRYLQLLVTMHAAANTLLNIAQPHRD